MLIKTQIDPTYILRRKILTINRFLLKQICIFDGDQFIAKLPPFSQFDENNLSLFDAHFQDLYIDKYQFLQIMLIMFQ